jgi:hypothetical protein
MREATVYLANTYSVIVKHYITYDVLFGVVVLCCVVLCCVVLCCVVLCCVVLCCDVLCCVYVFLPKTEKK